MAPKTKAKAARPEKRQTITLNALAAGFLGAPPPEAAGGSYGPTVNDHWTRLAIDAPDGDHDHKGWTFTIAGGRFVGARRAVHG
jgi:hypothetical protein